MEGEAKHVETREALERFRQDWLSEVARNRPSTRDAQDSGSHKRPVPHQSSSSAAIQPSVARRKDDFSEDVEPRAYHDLPDKEENLVLGKEGEQRDREPFKGPSSALEHYEHAVEKETQGQLGDSIKHYRQAFRVGPPPPLSKNIC